MSTINVKLNKKAKDVIAKTANIGGGETGSSLTVAPFVAIAAGNKVKIDFSVGTYLIREPFYPNKGEANQYIFDMSAPQLVEKLGTNQPSVCVEKNEAENQLIAHLFINDWDEYQSISDSIVIYDGDVSQLEDTSTIATNLPEVEFTVDSSYNNVVIGNIKKGWQITN